MFFSYFFQVFLKIIIAVTFLMFTGYLVTDLRNAYRVKKGRMILKKPGCLLLFVMAIGVSFLLAVLVFVFNLN